MTGKQYLPHNVWTLKRRFEKLGFRVAIIPTLYDKEYTFELTKDGHGIKGTYYDRVYYYTADNLVHMDNFINTCVGIYNKLYGEKKGNTEMNKIMNLANAKEVYLNCDGTIETPYVSCYKDQPGYVPYSVMAASVKRKSNLAIKDVIFNPPATIVFWTDGTKTVVKAGERDIYDPEKGLVMAITKKVFGNEGNYYNEIRKWVGKYEEEETSIQKAFALYYEQLGKVFGTVKNVEQTEEGVKAEVEITDEKWKIWFEKLNDFGEVYGYDVYPTEYKCKSSAHRRAKQIFNGTGVGWVVSKTDPWVEDGDPTWQE